ncbi:hypothetical protein PQX77_017652, partial [Marasmius sp. AFHP31]
MDTAVSFLGLRPLGYQEQDVRKDKATGFFLIDLRRGRRVLKTVITIVCRLNGPADLSRPEDPTGPTDLRRKGYRRTLSERARGRSTQWPPPE